MLKRTFDVIVATVLLVVLSPVLALIAVSIAIRLGRPIFFIQPRPGLHGKVFSLIKFRTMTDDRGADGELLSDEQRLGRFGRFLRSSSLDELPELFNILRGDMSLVGPRPLLVEYLPLYSAFQARRHEVRPGVTGWAQISGRNAISWEEKFAHDVWYVDHRSFLLDLRVLLLTAVQVIRRRGIDAPGEIGQQKFRG